GGGAAAALGGGALLPFFLSPLAPAFGPLAPACAVTPFAPPAPGAACAGERNANPTKASEARARKRRRTRLRAAERGGGFTRAWIAWDGASPNGPRLPRCDAS